jgi:hypothetical protein
MTDFVTRLESELHAAALRREQAGAVRRIAVPRIRLALRALPAAAAAAALVAVALTGAAIMLSSSPQRPADLGVPEVLRGIWRAPPTELRLYPIGSERCVNLGLGSANPCYTLGESSTGVAPEWGKLSVSADELTLGGMQGARPGVYRWRIQDGALRLTKVRDPISSRVKALVTTPLASEHPQSRAKLPDRWVSWRFTSRRFGYSIHLPHEWKRNSTANADRFSRDPFGPALPNLSVTVQDVAAGTSGARLGAMVDNRSEAAGCASYDFRRIVVDGVNFWISVHEACGGDNRQTASFVHAGRGYRVTWRGTAWRPEPDYPLFDALLKSIVFLR